MTYIKKWNLSYMSGGKHIETILQNQSKALCLWKRDQLIKTGNYKNGKLLIEKKWKDFYNTSALH